MQHLVNTITELLDREGSGINMRRDRPYNGQSHTVKGIRGAQEVYGVTMRDIRDAFIRAFIISHPCYEPESLTPIEPNYTLGENCNKGPDACICENDVYTLKGDFDPIAISQNLTCEIEKLMGIFPNIPGYKKVGYNEEPTKISSLEELPIDFPEGLYWI